MNTGYVYDGDKYDGLDEVAAVLVEEAPEGEAPQMAGLDVSYAIPYQLRPSFVEHVLEWLDDHAEVNEECTPPSQCLPKEIKEELTSVVAKITDFIAKNYWVEDKKISDEDFRELETEVVAEMASIAGQDAAENKAETK